MEYGEAYYWKGKHDIPTSANETERTVKNKKDS